MKTLTFSFVNKADFSWGDGVAQLVERQTQDPKVRTPSSGEQETIVSFSKCQNVVLTRCQFAQPPMCIHMHKKDHVRMLQILWYMSEFGGLWKHEKTHHAFIIN